MEAFQYLLISSLSELRNVSSDLSPKQIASFPFAIMTLIICISLYIFVCTYYLRYRKNFDPTSSTYFGEIFAGIGNKEEARLQPVFLLTRRLILVCLLVLVPAIGWLATLCIMTVLQALYLFVNAAVKPFEEKSNNIIDTTNEVFFLLFLLWHFYFNSNGRWNKSAINVFIGVMMFNNLIILFVIFGKFEVV